MVAAVPWVWAAWLGGSLVLGGWPTPLGQVGGSQFVHWARSWGYPWLKVAKVPLVSLSPDLQLQPGCAACAKFVFPTRWKALWVPRPTGWRPVS